MTDQHINEACAKFDEPLFLISKPCHAPHKYYRPGANGYTAKVEDAWHVTREEGENHVTCRNQSDRVELVPAPPKDYAGSYAAILPLVQKMPSASLKELSALGEAKHGKPLLCLNARALSLLYLEYRNATRPKLRFALEISATHPMNDFSPEREAAVFEADRLAMELVGERHEKRELVNLVRWLILRNPEGLL